MLRAKPLLMGFLTLAILGIAPTYASATEVVWVSGKEELKEGVQLNVTYKNVGNTILSGTFAGVKLEIVCEEENGGGWVENSVTTEMGLGLALLHYLKCKMPKPAGQGCLVHNMLFRASAHSLLLSTSEKTRDEFSPAQGTKLAEIEIENCTSTGLDGTFTLSGSATAEPNSETLNLEFTETSGSSLKFGGTKAVFTGKLKIEMEGGGTIQPVPVPVNITGTPSFGKVPVFTSKTHTFLLKNFGGLSYNTASIRTSLGQEAFTIVGDSCSNTGFPPLSECSIEVLFFPVVEKELYLSFLYYPLETSPGIKFNPRYPLLGEGE